MSQAVDIERDLADCVGAVYEAAASHGDWLEAGERIRRLLDARRGTLFLEDRSGALRNVLTLSDPGEAAYAAHFRAEPLCRQGRARLRRWAHPSGQDREGRR